jgi:hypothetical protein
MSTCLVCLVSIYTNSMQKTHDLNSFQMLMNVAPMVRPCLALLATS